MKIIVFSDSHGRTNRMLSAILDHNPDLVLHLGDHSSDCRELQMVFPELIIRNVRGNCDFGAHEPDTDEFVLCGKRIFMTHGHRYRVKTGMQDLLETAKGRMADIVLYGHTHLAREMELEGMRIYNPGSVGYEGTYGLLTITPDGKIT